jgi:LacI family transcriptional regulator
MSRCVRMKDIARDLKVSVVTVSKVLRNHEDISAATRQRVLKRVQELNYQPNWAARSLVTQRTYMVGMVIPDLMISFFAEVCKGVAGRLGPLGYYVAISNSEEDPEAEKQEIERLLARQMDGLIIASAQRHPDEDLFDSLETRKIPYVLIDRTLPGLHANYVGVRDEEIGSLATEHLIEQGCRFIAHIRGPMLSTGTGRLKGYRRVLAHHGLEVSARYVVNGGWRDDTGYLAMRELLKLDPRPDGVFCYNDAVAAGAIKAILEGGLNVPDDVAIIGAANIQYSDLLRVPLSTVDQSSLLIGEKAAELLVRLIEAKTTPSPERIFIPPRLVVRESSTRILKLRPAQ